MKYLIIWLCLSSVAFSDQIIQPALPKTFRYEKVTLLNHSYILISENVFGAETYIKHDPDCHCKRFTEEMIAKVVAEVIKLKDNQK